MTISKRMDPNKNRTLNRNGLLICCIHDHLNLIHQQFICFKRGSPLGKYRMQQLTKNVSHIVFMENGKITDASFNLMIIGSR